VTRDSLRLAVIGRGRMGHLIAEVAVERGHTVVLHLGHEALAAGELTAPALAETDVVVDFSHGDAVPATVTTAAAAGVNVVLGTTGWDRDASVRAQLQATVEMSGIGLLDAPNLAIGMSRFRRLVELAARLYAGDADADMWIEETHHAGKVDHPSGTALALGEQILRQLPWKQHLGTQLPSGPLSRSTLLVSSVRAGRNPGEHRVLIDSTDEAIELVHRAHSRRVFASGAVRAAEWLFGRRGWFALDDFDADIISAGVNTEADS